MDIASNMELNARKGNYYFPMEHREALIKDYTEFKDLFETRPVRWNFIAREGEEIETL